ncbi:MAG TPA: MaoC family dehydratase N-terminal domain-containing protein [Actinophytocola sp.]|uniref:MaoC family dehydratase N-terminal domain-containing protein n=1 Tax=Actinophytocola sp. TaxID=1872138 RepID=UPI002DB79BEF|nr:MaoC family dehydratase N-terminal domain-containing protein [Actinophytocola sp.]HEU5474757.1 MaoC family dehydratase N-terminal domain-containing protein [Actinophytocola sp.]
MGLDQSFSGRSYPPTWVYEVSREKIREFADSIGDSNPIHLDVDAAKAAGYEDVLAPPTFLTIVNIRAIDSIIHDPELGLDFGRMVHADQSFRFTRPVRAGDRLTVTAHIEDVATRLGNDFLSVRAEIATEDGEPVCTARASLVVRRAE